jgi:hypothetical protein
VATFTVDGTTATFHATIVSSDDSAGDLERLSLSLHWDTDGDWSTLYTLVTTKYHVHVPISGSAVVVDVAKGAGVGTLVISGLMSAHALLVDLRRNRWVRNGRELGSGTFLVTSIP